VAALEVVFSGTSVALRIQVRGAFGYIASILSSKNSLDGQQGGSQDMHTTAASRYNAKPRLLPAAPVVPFNQVKASCNDQHCFLHTAALRKCSAQ
jgi:hypothetical protein